MHDIRMIRDNPDGFDAALGKRGLAPVAAELVAADDAAGLAISSRMTSQITKPNLALLWYQSLI